MKSTFKILFYIRKDKINSLGKAPIHVRLTIDGQSCQFSTKSEITANIWDAKNYKAIGRTEEAETINCYLEHVKRHLLNKYQELTKYGEVITPNKVRDTFMGRDVKETTLLTTVAKFNDRHERLIGIEISQSWFNKYDLTYRRLEEFLKVKCKRKDIPLYLIDNDFVIDFHTFLKVDYSLSINSSEKLVRIFKRVMTKAFKDGIIPRDPFASYKIKKVKTDRGYLTEEEFFKIRDVHITNPRLEKIRDIFVFACYTGLDFSTLFSLTENNLIQKGDSFFIIAKRQKTGVESEIKMLSGAMEILKKYEHKRNSNYLLPVISNAKYNLYLKELAKLCGIEKRVTSHLARHTFATTITYANGVSIGAIQKMLGHTKISTTQIYSRMLDSTVEKEMTELEKVLNEKSTNKTRIYTKEAVNSANTF